MSMFSWRDATDVREMYEDAERRAAAERRERERQERLRAEEHHRRLQKRIDDRLREMQMKREEREAEKIQQEHARQDRILARVEAERAGVPYTSSRSSYGDPVAEWSEAVAEALALCGGNRQNAVIMANRRHPGLRERVIAAANSAR